MRLDKNKPWQIVKPLHDAHLLFSNLVNDS